MSQFDNQTCLLPEWVEQSAVFLAWPFAEGDFSPWLTEVEKTYLQIVSAVVPREILLIACQNETHRRHIETMIARGGIPLNRVQFVVAPYDDVWVRDTAPLSVISARGPALLDFRFNGWGGKYEYANDALLARRLHWAGVLGNIGLDFVDFVLEGGSVETDGDGVVMTTTRCLLNPNRNPEYSRSEIETVLSERLGAQKVLWLEYGYAEGDDTDAHIDTLARFCSPDTIAYTACDKPDDPLYDEFLAMAEQLATFSDRLGQPYRLVPLPIPSPILSESGDRLPATYANFLIINDAVLVPVYADPADSIALDRLAGCWPERTIIPIDCVSLIRQYGSLHCMTMQFPANTVSSC